MGSGGNSAARAAQREEARRQAIQQQTQAAVNAAYTNPGRQADIADLVSATREFNMGDLNRQKADTDRQLKFAMARGGQTGGSIQLNQGKRVGEEYGRGVLKVDSLARSAGADLEARDQEDRQRLIQLATSGLDATNAAQMAQSGMRSALQSGMSTSMVGGLGNVFGGFGDWLKESKDAAQRRRGLFDSGFSLYGNG